ncbi:hypothetical protein Lal_00013640 [Lupinus albus]|nr:hypothetical protein Lal_00013640 [Lupinus albus]
MEGKESRYEWFSSCACKQGKLRMLNLGSYIGPAGGGSIFRDFNGVFRGGFAVFFGLQAAFMTIEIVHQKGWKAIWLESDSATVVNILHGKGFVPWRLMNNWRVCLMRISSMRFKVSHIFREGNTCADMLAAFGVTSHLARIT